MPDRFHEIRKAYARAQTAAAESIVDAIGHKNYSAPAFQRFGPDDLVERELQGVPNVGSARPANILNGLREFGAVLSQW